MAAVRMIMVAMQKQVVAVTRVFACGGAAAAARRM
jgi:ribulose kinase